MNRQFSSWLKSSKGFSEAAAKDVKSRLKRVQSICTVEDGGDLSTTLFILGQQERFKTLSVSVRSQLRRAVKLYDEYISSQRVTASKD